MLAVAIPVSLVSAALEIVIDHYVDPSDALLSAGATLGSTGITMAGTVLLSGFACGLVGAARQGRDPLRFTQLARSLPWWRLIFADLVVTVAVVCGLVLFVLPGLAALTLLAAVGPVIEIEHRGVVAALHRSVALVRRHVWATLLLATVPLVVVAELEAIAPDPRHVGDIAGFLLVRGLAAGMAEACVAVLLVELSFQLIETESPSAVTTRPTRESPGVPGDHPGPSPP